MRIPVSVIIPTLNEADRLPACLASVAWADDVIVADAGSSDETVAIARRHGARVLERSGETIGRQKNAAISVARHPWIFSIDADERASPALRDAVADAIAAPVASAYRVRMRNAYLGVPYERGHWGRDWHVRLYPRALRWTSHRVHERLEVEGSIGQLHAPLDHEPYRDLTHQLQKCERYAQWGASDLQDRARTVGLSHLVLRPAWRFLRTFVLEGMWREGTRGFVFCVIHAWSAFAKYAIAWDHQRTRQTAPNPTGPHASAPLPFRRRAAPLDEATPDTKPATA